MNEDYVSVQKYISAINKLMTYSQNKKLYIDNNIFDTSDTVDYSLYLNDLIKKNIGIDIFSEKTPENIQKYEIELNRLLSDFIARKITKRDISDEVDIQSNSILINPNFVVDKTISISPSLDSYVSKLPISKEEIVDIAKEPILIAQYNGLKNVSNHYLLNSHVVIGEKNFNVVMHLSSERKTHNNFSIMSIFIISNNFSEKYERNPVRLFLACLDKYGLSLNINGKTKQIFGEEKVIGDETFLQGFNFLMVENVESIKSYFISATVLIERKNSILLDFVYGVNTELYLKDLQVLIKS